MSVRFKDFYFGFADSGYEASERPELLLHGYYDPMGVIDRARSSRKFLFLGYKGSGKSAIGEHLKLQAKEDPLLFVKMIDIAEISFANFSKILKEAFEPEARYPITWSWLLLLHLFDSFARDNGGRHSDAEGFAYALEVLREVGLLPEPKLKQIVTTTLDSKVSANLWGLLQGTLGSKKEAHTDLPWFVERLKLLAHDFRSESRHILVIDGLDEIFVRGKTEKVQWDAIAGLLFEANRLNLSFFANHTPAKVIVLCRPDMFERIPGANKNKIKQDCAVELNWYANPDESDHSPLVTLINLRARLQVGNDIDVFSEFLPHHMPPRNVPIKTFLLSYTRHTPRDIIMLFQRLQAKARTVGSLDVSQVYDAVDDYSRSYFLSEIENGLEGYFDGGHIKNLFWLLGAVGKTRPTLPELSQKARMLRFGEDYPLKEMLRQLFECSALGELDKRGGETFRHQNPHWTFNPYGQLTLHRGLWKALAYLHIKSCLDMTKAKLSWR